MKKYLAILLALALCLSLAACGSSAASAEAAASEAAASEAAASAEAAPAEAAPADAALCIRLLAACLTGCGSKGTTLAAVQKSGKLVIATSPDFPPFEFTDDSGAVVGIEPEIMELICQKIGLELDIQAMDFDGALLAAQQGKVDAVVSGVTVTEDRKLVMDFADSYTTITQAIVSKEGSGITMENLGDHTIGVQRGTTGHIYTEEDFGDKVVAYDTYSMVFQALNNDQVDCIVMDDAVAKSYLETNPGLEMGPTTYEPENYAFGFFKGNEALVAAVNGALQELIADGTIQSILDKYMSE